MNRFDLPPLWLAGAILLTWFVSRLTPDITIGRWLPFVGAFLIGIGFVLVFSALMEFYKAKTTVIPGRSPDALITTGIFPPFTQSDISCRRELFAWFHLLVLKRCWLCHLFWLLSGLFAHASSSGKKRSLRKFLVRHLTHINCRLGAGFNLLR